MPREKEREKRIYTCKHGKRLTWQQARLILDLKVRRPVKGVCLYEQSPIAEAIKLLKAVKAKASSAD